MELADLQTHVLFFFRLLVVFFSFFLWGGSPKPEKLGIKHLDISRFIKSVSLLSGNTPPARKLRCIDRHYWASFRKISKISRGHRTAHFHMCRTRSRLEFGQSQCSDQPAGPP